QTWSEISKRCFCENVVAFNRSMPAIDWVKQFHATQVGCCQGIRIPQLDVRVVSKFAVQITHGHAQHLIHHLCEANQIGAVSLPKGGEIFVSRFQMRIARCVVGSQTLCNFTPSKVRLEIDEAIHDNSGRVRLRAGMTNQPAHLSREIFSEAPAELSQTLLRLLKFCRSASPGPINVIMSDRD